MRLDNISDTNLMSSLCWFLTDTFVRHITGPIKPTPEGEWTFFSHPHTILSIAVFPCPVIWLASTPVFPAKVESPKTSLVIFLTDKKNKFTTCKPLFERGSVHPQPRALLLCVPQADPEHVFECLHPASHIFYQESLHRDVRAHVKWCRHIWMWCLCMFSFVRVTVHKLNQVNLTYFLSLKMFPQLSFQDEAFPDKGQNVFKDKTSGWPDIISFRSRCEGRSRVNLPQCDIPVPLHSLCEPDLLLAVCIQPWRPPRLKYYWRNNSSVFGVAPSPVDILSTAGLWIDQRIESDGTNPCWYLSLYLIVMVMHFKSEVITTYLCLQRQGRFSAPCWMFWLSRVPLYMKDGNKLYLIVLDR